MIIVKKIGRRLGYLQQKALHIAPLFGENNIFLPIRMFFTEALVRRRVFSVTICGLDLKLRSFTSDLAIANSWLRNDLAEQYSNVDHFDGVIVDAGGHIGMAAVSFARRFPHKKIITLEPSAENYELLQHNTASFENITALNCALGPEDGELQIIDKTGNTDGYVVESKADTTGNAGALPVVRVVSIPTLLKEIGGDRIALLKIDIEGFEVELLSGAPAWVGDVGLIAAELHERFRTGSTRAFIRATEMDREDLGFEGEMYFSVHSKQ